MNLRKHLATTSTNHICWNKWDVNRKAVHFERDMVTYYICDEALALDRNPFFPTQFWFKKGNHEGFNCDSKPQFQLEL